MASKEKLSEQTPSVTYQRRYDALSWHSADTDFENDPLVASKAKGSKIQRLQAFCTRRTRKLAALVVVVLVFLVIISGLVYLYYSRNSPLPEALQNIVMTECGKVAGNVISERSSDGTKNMECISYYAIPFAQPPVGKQRWRPPVSLSENKSHCWHGILHLHDHGIPCMQFDFNRTVVGSEDCLTLTVLTPRENDSSLLPVVVWISGSGLLNALSYAPGYSPSCDYTASLKIVSVMINYRLGAFGFLTLEELWIKGISYANYGLMDQVLGLKWIQANIKNFGGDPNSVTVMGHGSGGTSIYGLLASPLAASLFHKAIVLSGSPLLSKNYSTAAAENRVFVDRAGCYLNSTEMIRSCLYNLSGADVLSAMPLDTFPYWSWGNIMDLPSKSVAGGALLVTDPIVLPVRPDELHKHVHKRKVVPIIVGTTAQEIGIKPVQVMVNDSMQEFKDFLALKLGLFAEDLVSRILGVYLNESAAVNATVQLLYETMSSDVRMTCPTNLLTKSLSNTNFIRLFRYIVTNRPSAPIKLADHLARYSAHMWDAVALFGFKYNQFGPYVASVRDMAFMKDIRDCFRHFVYFGHMLDVDWVPFSEATALFTDHGIDFIHGTQFSEEQCRVWESYGFHTYAWLN